MSLKNISIVLVKPQIGENIGATARVMKNFGLSNTGTNAVTRVSIESTDRSKNSWFTIGVSPNIIEASFKALIDSIDYKLYKAQAPVNSQ